MGLFFLTRLFIGISRMLNFIFSHITSLNLLFNNLVAFIYKKRTLPAMLFFAGRKKKYYKYIFHITNILLFLSFTSYGQSVSNFGATRPQDTSKTKGQIVATAYGILGDTAVIIALPNGTFKQVPIGDVRGSGSGYTSGYGINFVGNRIDVDTATIAQLYKISVTGADTANWINSISVNPTMIKQGTDKDPILGVDTGIIATQYDNSLKLNISDTAAMLAPYVNFGDTNTVIATKSDIPIITTPNLQEVTDAGNITTNTIEVLDVNFDTVAGYSAARAAANLFAGSDSVKFAFCILRPAIDGGGNITWSLLTDADHMPLRFSSLSYGAGPIMTVSFTNPTAVKILTCHVTPDETLANYGVTSGAKANLTNIQIELSWPKGNWAGLMFRDSTNTWRFSPNIASSTVTEYSPNGFAWEETSSSQMGGKINAISDYQGMVSAGYEYIYAGTSGYRLVKAQNFPYYLQKRMQLVDLYGNAVPLTALTHLDMIQVNSNRSFQMNPQWNYNIWSLFSASSNLWVTLVYQHIDLWFLLLGMPFRIRRTKRWFRVELINMFRA